jgi:hypothetical protein
MQGRTQDMIHTTRLCPDLTQDYMIYYKNAEMISPTPSIHTIEIHLSSPLPFDFFSFLDTYDAYR